MTNLLYEGCIPPFFNDNTEHDIMELYTTHYGMPTIRPQIPEIPEK
jgi:hypothetical protein